jgi:hypothetical protein
LIAIKSVIVIEVQINPIRNPLLSVTRSPICDNILDLREKKIPKVGENCTERGFIILHPSSNVIEVINSVRMRRGGNV